MNNPLLVHLIMAKLESLRAWTLEYNYLSYTIPSYPFLSPPPPLKNSKDLQGRLMVQISTPAGPGRVHFGRKISPQNTIKFESNIQRG